MQTYFNNYLLFTNYTVYMIGSLRVLMQVWDIGGQTLGGQMLDKYISGCHVSVIFNEIVS